ncbi:MAG: hypothetical protein CW716_09640 [Candidatus Bathyarchaeum sp.]|nr:MAG: hypothetical protein CW716_09640 [Candidatus Bathyarchaeum sp.]
MAESKVSWLSWSEESFRKARELDRPILLGISAVWCHWCHVMDNTTYSVDKVAKFIEEKFVPIRVDRDKRPDIDRRYNMGGWPSTVFLTPDGEVLMGGTYIPPQQMMVMLDHVSLLYEKSKGTLKSKIKELQKELKMPQEQLSVDNEEFSSVVDDLTLAIASRYDDVHAGFGEAPKFPHSGALRFALLQYRLRGHKGALNMVTKTLTAMASGGIYDKEEGGFFRYSTTRDWSIPHYEKMCEDNAKLLVNYLEAYQLTEEAEFRKTAKGILDYISNNLSDQQKGGFFGSQDADEVYYKLSLAERKSKLAPRIDRTLFVNWNAMMASSYLLAGVVLDEQKYQKFALKTVDLLLGSAFSSETGIKHYIADGESHVSGLLTDQVYMINCLIDCYQVGSDRKYLEAAEALARFLLEKMWDSTGFVDRLEDENDFGALQLADKPLEENSVAAYSFLRLYHLTGNKKYLDTSKKTLEAFAKKYHKYGIMASSYGLAVEFYLNPVQVHVVGSKKLETTKQLLKETLKTYSPLKIVEIIDPQENKERLKALGYPETKTATAYVCSGEKCNSTEDPKELAELIGGKQSGN